MNESQVMDDHFLSLLESAKNLNMGCEGLAS